jgi:hypothetical protein
MKTIKRPAVLPAQLAGDAAPCNGPIGVAFAAGGVDQAANRKPSRLV